MPVPVKNPETFLLCTLSKITVTKQEHKLRYFAATMEWWIYVLVCLGALFAGFIDAVVGGGGLVQVPLLLILFPELSHVQVIASNRFASLAGTSVAAYQYIKMIGVDTSVVLATGIAAAIASFSGTFFT